MPLSLASDQSPGPIDTDTELVVAITDPDGATAGPLNYVLIIFDDGQIEYAVFGDASQPGYTLSTSEGIQHVTRDAGWRRSFSLVLIGSNLYPAPFQSAALRFSVKAGVTNNPVARQLELARERIEAIEPITDTGVSFEAVPGDLALEEEPPVGRRRFSVELDPSPPLPQSMMAERSRQASRRLRIRVRYDALNDRTALDETIAADDDAIAWALEGLPYASGVQLVTLVDAQTEAADGFTLRTLTFDVLYVTQHNPG